MKNQYEIRGDVTAIFLRKKDGNIVVTLVDSTDLERLVKLGVSWCVSGCGRYAVARLKVAKGQYKLILLHRYITDAPKGYHVDHYNHNTFDNTRSNLRVATASENGQNRLSANKNSKTGVRGVSKHSLVDKWSAEVWLNRKKIYLGLYDTIEEAEAVVKEFRAKHMPYSKESLGA